MARVHFNNSTTTLDGNVTDIATSITFNDSIPTIGAGNYVCYTITDGTNFEIIKISSNAGAPTYTVARAQEGTVAQAWTDGDTVECRDTAASYDGKQDKIDGLAITQVTLDAADKVLIQDD